MKIVIDAGSGKSCWGCNHLKRGLGLGSLAVPIQPFCFVFEKQIDIKNGKALRLAECLAAEQTETTISINDIETFTNEEWE